MIGQDGTAVEVEERWVRSEDGRLFARAWAPERPSSLSLAPILLLHDSLGCTALWRDFPARLAAATGRRVITYDRLGFGRSDAHPGKLGFDFVADEAERSVPRVLEAFGVGPFVVCGHSVGGGMAAETAARNHGRCRALVTIAAQAFVEDRTLAGIREAKAALHRPESLERLARHHGDKAKWALDAWTETWLAPEFAHWTIDAALERVACPVLAVHGDRDEYGSLRHPERIAEGRGRTCILGGVGHVPHRECPDRLVAEIAAFLSEAAN